MNEKSLDASGTITDEEWENRRLCDDGACIGVIGQDGRCKECGKPGSGKIWESRPLEQDCGETGPEPEESQQDLGEEAHAPDEEWEQRTLCRDDNCIGVIGPDGRCKECGLPLEDE